MHVVLLGLVGLTSGCIAPYALPPVRAEVGAASPIGTRSNPNPDFEQSQAAIHGAVGIHAASGTTRDDLPGDLGIGAIIESSGPEAKVMGGYVEGSMFLTRDRGARNARTALGVRVEVRETPLGLAAVTKARFDAEITKAGEGAFEADDRCGFTAGVYRGTGGIGLYAEGGPAFTPDGIAFVASAGVTLRIPAVLGFLIAIPGCK